MKHPLGVFVLTSALFAGCSSTGMPGPHVAPAPVIKGDYTAFLSKTWQTAQLGLLQAQLAAMPWVGRPGGMVGVLVIALTRKATQAQRDQVLTLLQSSAAVDHVELGGCDIRLTECQAWSSSSTSTP